jgi:hypothetical protein
VEPKSAAGTHYRIVRTNPPTDEDFKSYTALGIKPRKPNPDPETLHLFDGVSVLDTPERARAYIEKGKVRGEYIARLDIPEGTSITYEGPKRGHGNLYDAPPDVLSGYVTDVLHYTEIQPADV